MSTAIIKFADRLAGVLGPPKVQNFDAYRNELEVHLGRFSEDELQEAATILFQNQKYKSWPMPGEMIAAAEEARKLLLRPTIASLDESDRRRQEDRTKSDAKSFAAHWLATNELGRQAILEGWARTLQKLLIQKYELNQCFGKPDLNAITFPPDDIKYFRKYSKPLNPQVDLKVIFGDQEGDAWYQKYLEAKHDTA